MAVIKLTAPQPDKAPASGRFFARIKPLKLDFSLHAVTKPNKNITYYNRSKGVGNAHLHKFAVFYLMAFAS